MTFLWPLLWGKLRESGCCGLTQAAKYHAATLSHPFISKRKTKQKKTIQNKKNTLQVWDRSNLMAGTAKATLKQKEKNITYFPSASHVQPFGKLHSVCIMVTWENRWFFNKSPPRLLWLSMPSYGMEYPTLSLDQLLCWCPFSTSCPSSTYLPLWWGRISETALIPCQHCSATANTLVHCFALCISAILATNAKHISVWAAVGKGNSIPTRAGTQIPNVIQRANTFLRWRSVTETEPPTQKTIIPSKLVIAILSRSKAGLSQFHNSSMEFSSWAESTSPFLWSSFKFFLPSSCDSVDTFRIYFLKKSFLISVN